MVGRLWFGLLLYGCAVAASPPCERRNLVSAGEVTLVTAISLNPLREPGEALACVEHLSRSGLKTAGLVRVMIASDEVDAASYWPKGPLEAYLTNWDGWLKLWNEARLPRRGMAEAVYSPVGLSLRFRSPDGQISKQVIWGRDPTLIRIGPVTFEIIYLTTSGILPGVSSPSGGPVRRLDAFAVSSEPLRENLCLQLVRQLRQDLNLDWILLRVGSDPFFIFTSAFPVRHPLVSYPPLPQESEYLKTPNVSCTADRQKASCITYPLPEWRIGTGDQP